VETLIKDLYRTLFSFDRYRFVLSWGSTSLEVLIPGHLTLLWLTPERVFGKWLGIGQLLFESIWGASLKLQAPSGKLGACGNLDNL